MAPLVPSSEAAVIQYHDDRFESFYLDVDIMPLAPLTDIILFLV